MLNDGGIVGGQRQTLPVVDGSTRQAPDDVEDTRVVFVASSAIRLHAEMRLHEVVVGVNDLDVDHRGDERDGTDRKRAAEPRTGTRKGSVAAADAHFTSIAESNPSAAKLAAIAEPP